MDPVKAYQQYFAADCTYNERLRHGASVMLIAASEGGMIRYEAAVSFFPHDDPEDFAVSYDAYASKELYSGKGRRSRKREAVLLETLREHIDELAQSLGGTVDWETPLRDARFG